MKSCVHCKTLKHFILFNVRIERLHLLREQAVTFFILWLDSSDTKMSWFEYFEWYIIHGLFILDLKYSFDLDRLYNQSVTVTSTTLLHILLEHIHLCTQLY